MLPRQFRWLGELNTRVRTADSSASAAMSSRPWLDSGSPSVTSKLSAARVHSCKW